MSSRTNKKIESVINFIFQHKFKAKNVGIIGLLVSSFGAIIFALSFTASDGRITSQRTGFEYHLAVISDYGFKIGLYLLILGFLFQILEKRNYVENNIQLGKIILTILMSLILYIYIIKFVSFLLFL